MKYFLFLLSSFLLAATTAYAQEQPTSTRISVSGHIVDEQEQPVPFATVSVGHSGKGVVSDEEGFFFIKFPVSDTLILSTVAHRTQYLYFGDTATTENYDLKIRLSEEAYELQSVTVFAFKDEYAFKKAILELDDLPEENEKIVIPGSYDGPRREVKPSVMSPVSLVASIFSKRAKYEREAREKIAASKRSNALAQQYSRELVGKVTGLEEEKLDKFMTYCQMKDVFRERPNEYEVIVAINQCFSDFRQEQGM